MIPSKGQQEPEWSQPLWPPARSDRESDMDLVTGPHFDDPFHVLSTRGTTAVTLCQVQVLEPHYTEGKYGDVTCPTCQKLALPDLSDKKIRWVIGLINDELRQRPASEDEGQDPESKRTRRACPSHG